MRTLIFLLLAAFPPGATWVQSLPGSSAQIAQLQNRPSSQPRTLEDAPAPNHLSPGTQEWVTTMTDRLNKAIAQKDTDAIEQLKLDATKHMITGLTLCGHGMDSGTVVDAVSLNGSQQQAIAVRWLDVRNANMHSAIFTGEGRCVAKDGDIVDGKLISRVLPNALAVSNQHGLTAWEAEYWNSPAEQASGGASHRAVFIEDRFLAALDPRKASLPGSRETSNRPPDFHWNDAQETVTVRPDILLAPANPSTAQAKSTSLPCPAPAKPGFLDKLKQRAAKALDKQAANADAQIGKATKGNVDAGVRDATASAVNDAAQPDPCNPQKGQGKKQ